MDTSKNINIAYLKSGIYFRENKEKKENKVNKENTYKIKYLCKSDGFKNSYDSFLRYKNNIKINKLN